MRDIGRTKDYGGSMPVILRAAVLMAGAVALNVAVSDRASAQSLYDAISAFAETPGSATPAPRSRNDGASEAEEEIEAPVAAPPSTRSRKTAATARRKSVKLKANGNKRRFQPVANASAENWPHSEVMIARARCKHLIGRIDAEVELMEPIKRGPCGDPAPVKLKSLGRNPRVAVEPAAIVNCDMVVTMHDWLVKDLQPLARRHMKSPIVQIETMSSYSCRNAYGRKNGRLSQHATANAMDIRGFVTARQSKARLLAHWGPTARDIRTAKLRREKKKAKERLLARKNMPERAPSQSAGEHDVAPEAASGPVLAATEGDTVGAAAIRPSLLDGVTALVRDNLKAGIEGDAAKVTLTLTSPSRLGGPALSEVKDAVSAAPEPSWPVYLVSDKPKLSKMSTGRAKFLRAAHKQACGRFGTVLGPEANNTHRNHFHVDLADRELGPYCR